MEERLDLPRLLVAAPASGSGKTTVTCALLRAFQRRGLDPCAFKCGPDYIDPMFHREVLGLPSRNLDLFFSGEDQARALLSSAGRGRGVAVLEGVMGCYDGVGGTERASSWHLARATGTPILLVVRPQGAALTLAAMVRGLARFRSPGMIGGLLLNGCSRGLAELPTPMLQRETGLPVLGWLPQLPDCAIASRHLGLLTPGEVQGLADKVDRLASQLEETVDLDGLLELAASAPELEDPGPPPAPAPGTGPSASTMRTIWICCGGTAFGWRSSAPWRTGRCPPGAAACTWAGAIRSCGRSSSAGTPPCAGPSGKPSGAGCPPWRSAAASSTSRAVWRTRRAGHGPWRASWRGRGRTAGGGSPSDTSPCARRGTTPI